MRVCLVYDCLFPHTVGGAERWYRSLAERLAADGHEVSYLTLRQWDRGADPGVKGVEVRVVGPRMALYARGGRRRTVPPMVFGIGVLWHLLRHGHRYDAVHTCSFPYFSVLAAAAVRPRWGYRLVVDWFEVWTRNYWREYLGPIAGDIGWLVQRLCAHVPHRAFSFSRRYAARLKEQGTRGEVTVLAGIYDGPLEARPEPSVGALVLFAGRHIAEKRVTAIVPAIARARARLPGVRAAIVGDGPERPEVLRLVRECGVEDVVIVPGFVASETVDELMGRALCMLLPSRREGYGLVVIEAAARGTPSIVVPDPDNAAVELIEDEVNGIIAPSVSPEDLAAAIVRVNDAGAPLRRSTAAWFTANAARLSLERSLEVVIGSYADGDALRAPDPARISSSGPEMPFR
jgi:glycosyltransferase involved in cell wall biosynthesis